jgi:hypothetical protein
MKTLQKLKIGKFEASYLFILGGVRVGISDCVITSSIVNNKTFRGTSLKIDIRIVGAIGF